MEFLGYLAPISTKAKKTRLRESASFEPLSVTRSSAIAEEPSDAIVSTNPADTRRRHKLA